MAYVNNTIQVKRRKDLETHDLEILWLETCPHISKQPLFVGGIYRPPPYKVAEDKRLEKNFENVHLLNREMVLLGDINVAWNIYLLNFPYFTNRNMKRSVNMDSIV